MIAYRVTKVAAKSSIPIDVLLEGCDGPISYGVWVIFQTFVWRKGDFEIAVTRTPVDCHGWVLLLEDTSENTLIWRVQLVRDVCQKIKFSCKKIQVYFKLKFSIEIPGIGLKDCSSATSAPPPSGYPIFSQALFISKWSESHVKVGSQGLVSPWAFDPSRSSAPSVTWGMSTSPSFPKCGSKSVAAESWGPIWITPLRSFRPFPKYSGQSCVN